MRTLNEAVPVESEDIEDEWADLDRLRGLKWPEEVLRRRKILVQRLEKSKQEASGPLRQLALDKKKLAEFDEQLRPRMSRRRTRLRRLFGTHFTTDDGQITITETKKVLDYDKKRSKEILAELQQRHVRKAIRTVESIDDDALKSMSSSFLRSLRHLGVTVEKMYYVGIKTSGEKESTNILRERRVKK